MDKAQKDELRKRAVEVLESGDAEALKGLMRQVEKDVGGRLDAFVETLAEKNFEFSQIVSTNLIALSHPGIPDATTKDFILLASMALYRLAQLKKG